MTATRAASPPIRSIDEVHEPAVRAAIESWIARPETLGFLFCGSRATGWAEPDGDYDAFVYVTRDYYRSLDIDATQVRIFAEGETPKRMIGDFSLFSDEVFEEQLRSPLDIDHWSYVDSVIVSDKTGALAEWTRRLSAFPMDQLRERAMQKYLQLVIDYHYATIADVRGLAFERQLSLSRAALAAVHLWFTLKGRWAPPLKWMTREMERLEIRPDTRAVLEGAVLNPSIEMLTHCRDHLKSEMRHAGITETDDLLRFFFSTFLPEHRESVYRNTYL